MDSVLTYQEGNQWQRNRYAFMSKFNVNAGVREFGHAKKGETIYFHLLTENNELHNFLNEERIIKAVKKRFEKKAGDLPRVLTNTVSSQPCCFNLFVPLQENPELSSLLFSELLEKEVNIDEIIIEFTPETEGKYGDESLGDQGNDRGTDADVAVFYNDGKSKGVIFIEFKYIESEFSRCGSYKNDKKKTFRNICDSPGYYKTLIEPNLVNKRGRFKCGYLKYNNWELTKESRVFNNSVVVNNQECPFKFSGQQLWRNLLLTENVAKSRKLDEFHFWVLSPVENSFLWKENGKDVEAEIRNVLIPSRTSIFRRLELDKDFFQVLKPLINDEWMTKWSKKFEERYLTGTKI